MEHTRWRGLLIPFAIWTNLWGKFMKLPNWLMPAFLSFGSVFIVIGLSGTLSYFALIGALMLSLGLCTLFIKVQNLEKEIKVLKSKNKKWCLIVCAKVGHITMCWRPTKFGASPQSLRLSWFVSRTTFSFRGTYQAPTCFSPSRSECLESEEPLYGLAGLELRMGIFR